MASGTPPVEGDAPAAVAHTRVRIRSAAVAAFAERGYRATSLRDIARAVGIEVGSLYNHITSKEGLLFELVEVASLEFIAQLTAALEEAPADPRARLLALVEQTAIYHGHDQAQSFIGLSEMRELTAEHRERAVELRGQVEAMFREAVSECVRLGYLDPKTPLSVTANFLIGMSTSVATWYREGGSMSVEEVAASATSIVGPWLHLDR